MDVTSTAYARGLRSLRAEMSTRHGWAWPAYRRACGTKGVSTTAPMNQAAAEDRSDIDKTVVWFSWSEDIDIDEKTQKLPIDEFEKQTGIKVTYTEDQDDNEAGSRTARRRWMRTRTPDAICGSAPTGWWPTSYG